jgi:hypothetical protein
MRCSPIGFRPESAIGPNCAPPSSRPTDRPRHCRSCPGRYASSGSALVPPHPHAHGLADAASLRQSLLVHTLMIRSWIHLFLQWKTCISRPRCGRQRRSHRSSRGRFQRYLLNDLRRQLTRYDTVAHRPCWEGVGANPQGSRPDYVTPSDLRASLVSVKGLSDSGGEVEACLKQRSY